MNRKNLIGPWIRRFLLEHLVADRNLSRNTQASYRDALILLLPFVCRKAKKAVDQLNVENISPENLRSFLRYLEEDRGCSIATRNQRLSAIHAMARFIGMRSPQDLAWCTEICAIPLKKTSRPVMCYLEKAEMDALLDAPDRNSAQGLRDYVMLLFLYNTGARANEAAHVNIRDLSLDASPPSVRLIGKGGKVRHCPLWSSTCKEMGGLVAGRMPNERAFLNRRKQPMTRFGIHALVKRHAVKASRMVTSLCKKQVGPHTVRHTSAVHLLRAGVDINTIRAWLGHASLDTTHIYAEVDIAMKAKALAHCDIPDNRKQSKWWRDDKGLMTFLKGLTQ